MHRGRGGLATVSGWGAITTWIVFLAFCARHATAADRFDYHSVRGRRPNTAAAQRHEGAADLALRGVSRVPTSTSDTTNDAMPLTSDELVAATRQFCFRCHGGDATKAELDLSGFGNRDAPPADARIVQQIRDRIVHREMPPKDEPFPDDDMRRRLVATLDRQIDEHLRTHDLDVPVVMRRLNRYEYNNAVRDLLHLRGDIYPLPEKTIRVDSPYFDPASGRFPDELSVRNRAMGKEHIENQILSGVTPFAIDLQAEGGFNNRGSELGMSPVLLESLLTLGTAIVESPEFDSYCSAWETLFADPSAPTPGQPPATSPESEARQRLARLLEVAFRCRIDDDLLDRYHQVFMERLKATGSFPRAMKDAVAAVLSSPRFLYLAEAAATDGETHLDGYELATRLSFFLWSSLPDEPLLATARDGSLLRDDVLAAQVERMLADPRCRALAENFARQWLRLDRMVAATPDFERFPHYYARIGCEQWKFGVVMMTEPLLLFESILVEDRSIMLLVDSNYAYRSDDLQEWYGGAVPFATRDNENRFGAWSAQHFRRRPLEDRRQGGVVTSAAILTMTSSPLRTNPITRGAWVATVILNRPPPPPPDAIPPIEEDDRAIEAQGLTLRQRLTSHQTNASCAACHAQIDPLGFVLENYDAVGRWRDCYPSGLEIDSGGELFGELQFSDIVGLKDQLLDHPDIFFRAFSEQLLSYAIGRGLELNDAPAVDRIVARVEADHGQFSTVVQAIVASPPFRQRPAVTPVTGPPATEEEPE